MINKDKYHTNLEASERITLEARAKAWGITTAAKEPIAVPHDANVDLYIAENSKLNKDLEKIKAENIKLKLSLEEITQKYADAISQGEHLIEDCDEVKAKLADREAVLEQKSQEIKKISAELKKLKKVVSSLTANGEAP